MQVIPVIDQDKCDGCGLCVRIGCRCLILVNEGLTFVEAEECGWCAQCEAVCPIGAISCPVEIVIEEYHLVLGD
jgi:TPP-dependent indolepyruvate ferredoxin oxidoreductase alpha subunit